MAEVDMAKDCQAIFEDGLATYKCDGYKGHDGPHYGYPDRRREWTDEEATGESL